jgi:histone H3/H4
MAKIEKKLGGKAPAKGIASERKDTLGASQKMRKRRPFEKDGVYSVPKVAHNIRRTIRHRTKFGAALPQLSGSSIEACAGMVLTMAQDIADEAARCSRKVGKQTISSGEITTAIKVIFRGELLSHCLTAVDQHLQKTKAKKTK